MTDNNNNLTNQYQSQYKSSSLVNNNKTLTTNLPINAIHSSTNQQLQNQIQKLTLEENNNHIQENNINIQSTNLKKTNQNHTELHHQLQQHSEQQTTTQLTETKYFININRTSIPFGKTTLFPGSIEEVDVTIELKEDILEQSINNPFMLRVIAKCDNHQFNDLDEYVFSVRSNQRFEYFEEVRFKIRKSEKAQLKVAVKIPPVKQNCVIEGCLEVQLEGLQPVWYPIVAKCEIPQIACIKDLYKPDEDTQVIKVPAKKNQIRMPPIPFKNLSNFNFTLEVEAISNESFSNKPYDIITQNFVNCQANTQFFVNLQLKENMSYKGPLPAKETIRKILILKIKNSSVYFNYPLEVFVFQSLHAGGMS